MIGADYQLAWRGLLCLIIPHTEACREWLEAHSVEDAPWHEGGLVVTDTDQLDNLLAALRQRAGL